MHSMPLALPLKRLTASQLYQQSQRARVKVDKAIQDAFDLPRPSTAYPQPSRSWISGVDHLEHLGEDEAWSLLGVPKFKIPGMIGPPLHWHQVIGVIHMLYNFFRGKGTLNCDEVGLGKTLQILAFFAMISANRQAKETHGRFLGFLGLSDSSISCDSVISKPQLIRYLIKPTRKETYRVFPS